MPNVTVEGVGGRYVTIPFTTEMNAALAQVAANAITAAINAGTIIPVDYPTPPPGPNSEQVVTVAGGATVNQPSQAISVTTPNTQILASASFSPQTVIAGGGALQYTNTAAATAGPSIVFVNGFTNQLNSFSEAAQTAFNIDTGDGSDGTTVNAALGASSVNLYVGSTTVNGPQAGHGGTVIYDWGGNLVMPLAGPSPAMPEITLAGNSNATLTGLAMLGTPLNTLTSFYGNNSLTTDAGVWIGTNRNSSLTIGSTGPAVRDTVVAFGNDTLTATANTAAELNLTTGAQLVLNGGVFHLNATEGGSSVFLGGNDTVTLGDAASSAALGLTPLAVSGGAVVGTGSYIVTSASGPGFVSAGASDATVVFGRPGTIWTNATGSIVNAPIAADVAVPRGSLVFNGGTGSQTVFGGLGETFYGGTDGNNLLYGAVTMWGGGAGDTIVGSESTFALIASAGNTTLVGSLGPVAGGLEGFWLSRSTSPTDTGEDQVFGSNYNVNSFALGTGNATVVGGAGAGLANYYQDLNQATPISRIVEITNFRQGLDQVVLNPNGPGDTGATANVSGQTVVGSAVYVGLSDNLIIRFDNLSSVTAADFNLSKGGHVV